MLRRMLMVGLVLGLAGGVVGVRADEPKKRNPFVDDTPAEKKGDKKAEDKETKTDTAKRIAHIKLSGSLDEAPVGESLFGAAGENLRAKLGRIRKAAKDDQVAALYLQLGGLDAGFGKLHELKKAIAEFRATGKKVYAYAEELSTKEYLLALACDEVILPESGGLSVYGLRAEVTFYKNTLEMLKVKADVLKVGDYKSAVEPYLADKMSDANREQIESMLDDTFSKEIVDVMIASRPAKKWTPGQVKSVIDQGPFTAKKAAELGLVDRLAYPDEIVGIIQKGIKADEVKLVEDYGKVKTEAPDFSNPFKLLEALSPPKKRESKEPKIAVVYLVGGISSGKGSYNPLMGGSSVGSDTIVEAIQQAEKDPTVKAIVLRVDSPGGSALASDMIWRALKVCKKPVVASMGDVAASGGYYVAMAGAKIFAEPGTVTGSIGVFGMKFVTGGIEEMAGMKTEVISRGKNSGVNSTTFPWSESERKAMTLTIEEIYTMFVDKALAGRKGAGVKMTREQLLKLAGGRVWTGRQAKAAGLIDELGTLDDAINYAKTLAKIDPKTEMEIQQLPKGGSFLDKLGDGGLPFSSLDLTTIPGAKKALKLAAPVLQTANEPVKMLMPFMVEFK
ncbi:MAG: signal peptide peptidase SppA [Fimbriiglobus sp.]